MCQKRDWPDHKLTCRRIKDELDNIGPQAVDAARKAGKMRVEMLGRWRQLQQQSGVLETVACHFFSDEAVRPRHLVMMQIRLRIEDEGAPNRRLVVHCIDTLTIVDHLHATKTDPRAGEPIKQYLTSEAFRARYALTLCKIEHHGATDNSWYQLSAVAVGTPADIAARVGPSPKRVAELAALLDAEADLPTTTHLGDQVVTDSLIGTTTTHTTRWNKEGDTFARLGGRIAADDLNAAANRWIDERLRICETVALVANFQRPKTSWDEPVAVDVQLERVGEGGACRARSLRVHPRDKFLTSIKSPPAAELLHELCMDGDPAGPALSPVLVVRLGTMHQVMPVPYVLLVTLPKAGITEARLGEITEATMLEALNAAKMSVLTCA